MPVLPLPFPVLPSGGDLPVSSSADVLAQYPERVRRESAAPVRDGIVEGQAGMFLAYQEASAYAAAQCDATRATGIYLEAITADVEIFKQEGEDDEALRDRYFSIPQVATPAAIKALINQVFAPYTDVEAQVFESVLDRWFVSDGTATWHSFVTDGTVDLSPDYPDRIYDDKPQASPGGAWAFDEHAGRYFIVRLPQINTTVDTAFVFDGDQSLTHEPVVGWFTTDGTVTDGDVNAYLYTASALALDVYQAVANVLEQAKGHGVRFQILVDPKL